MMETVDYQQALLDEAKEVPRELLPSLIEIVRLYKQSILSYQTKQWKDLQQEFKEWDMLSDEALLNFEKGL